jgi:hypothetical protein
VTTFLGKAGVLGKPVSSMIQASIAPLPSMIGTVSSWIRLRTRSSDHAALATKCSSDWCLAETRAGAVTAAIGSTLLRSPGSSKPRQ